MPKANKPEDFDVILKPDVDPTPPIVPLKILFVLKDPNAPINAYSNESNTGIFVSARLLKAMLEDKFNCTTDLIFITSVDQIKTEVTAFRPNVVFIEAYWVSPEDFSDLTTRFPNVRWVVRNHSATPFLSLEDTVVDWSLRYMDYPKVTLACNEVRTTKEFANLIAIRKPNWDDSILRTRVITLPNYYPAILRQRTRAEQIAKELHRRQRLFDVACFGAVRPLKNQLMQAVAAISYAEEHGLVLSFHINVTSSEEDSAILKNLRALFTNLPQFTLVEHPWLSHEDFLQLCRQMDLGMQVTFSETFNIATADLVVSGVPVVVSPEIFWVDDDFMADPTKCDDIIASIARALKAKLLKPAGSLTAYIDPDDSEIEIQAKIALAKGEKAAMKNIDGLQKYDDWSVPMWEKFLFHSN